MNSIEVCLLLKQLTDLPALSCAFKSRGLARLLASLSLKSTFKLLSSPSNRALHEKAACPGQGYLSVHQVLQLAPTSRSLCSQGNVSLQTISTSCAPSKAAWAPALELPFVCEENKILPLVAQAKTPSGPPKTRDTLEPFQQGWNSIAWSLAHTEGWAPGTAS